MSRDVWKEIAEQPSTLKPWGSALTPKQGGRIIKPMLITEPTARITRPELVKAMKEQSE